MNINPKTSYKMKKDFTPGFRDTKVVLRRIKEYSGRWMETTGTMFFEGKPPKHKITDEICRACSKGDDVIVDAEFDICEVTLQDYAACYGGT